METGERAAAALQRRPGPPMAPAETSRERARRAPAGLPLADGDQPAPGGEKNGAEAWRQRKSAGPKAAESNLHGATVHHWPAVGNGGADARSSD